MKFAAAAFAAVGLAVGFLSQGPSKEPEVLLFGGDSLGSLAPCGCTEPMMGGIRRRAAAIRQLWTPGRTTLLENGGLVATLGRQSELKAEMLAETLASLGVAAINLGASDAALGIGNLLSIERLSGGKVLSSSLEASTTNGLAQYATSGSFLIAGVTDDAARSAAQLRERPVRTEVAVQRFVYEASGRGLQPILMLQGDRAEATSLARSFPGLRLILYRSKGTPPGKVEWAGETALVTSGDQEKYLVRLDYASGKFGSYSVVSLSPAYRDDPTALRFYRQYQARVSSEALLDRLPRTRTDPFAGSRVCGSCHTNSLAVWRKSGHAHGLADLEKDGHDRDPDCVACHVVGLSSKYGFSSRLKTPWLANVGCENCHGPGKGHALDPYRVRMPKAGERSCAPCHDSEHSPGFRFAPFWAKIRHK